MKEGEQKVFEEWLSNKSPSGDHESVQRQWLESSDYAEWSWDVGADGIPVKKGDFVTEEDGELIYVHTDGTTTKFVTL